MESVSKLKDSIRVSISQELQTFTEKTGMSPSRIDLVFVEVTAHGDRVRKYVIGDVKLGFGEY